MLAETQGKLPLQKSDVEDQSFYKPAKLYGSH